jgi:hypothetical protein
MVVLNEGKSTELSLRVVLESEAYGREFFDNFDDMGELLQAVKRLVKNAVDESAQDGFERVVSIAIVPKAQYGDGNGYGFGLESEKVCP